MRGIPRQLQFKLRSLYPENLERQKSHQSTDDNTNAPKHENLVCRVQQKKHVD